MLKIFEVMLVGLGYKISESTKTILVVYNITNHLIISITPSNKVVIAKETDQDIRFKGIVDNAIQLKLILNCIKRDL